jgi:hypothetical protein
MVLAYVEIVSFADVTPSDAATATPTPKVPARSETATR